MVKRAFFPGWTVVVGSGVGIAFGSLVFFAQGFALLSAAIGAQFGWTQTDLAKAATIFLLLQMAMYPVCGWFLDRWGSRKFAMASIVMFAASLAVLSRIANSLPQFYLAFVLIGLVSAGTNVIEYCRIIKGKAIVRRLINASNNIITRCLEGSEEPQALIDAAQSQMFEIAEQKTQSGFLGITDIVKTSFGSIDVLFDRGQRVTGIETGFTKLDDLTSGLQPGELIIIAARPSLGKTALALNIAAYAATVRKNVVGVFSLEMSKESLLIRLLCSEARINSHKLRTGFSSREDWTKMTQALARLAGSPLFIEDAPALSIMQIRAKARRLKAEKGLDLMIVDYLQLVTGQSRFENRTQEVSYISRSLKGIAKELHVPVVALSQLSRAPEMRPGHQPQLSDLHE